MPVMQATLVSNSGNVRGAIETMKDKKPIEQEIQHLESRISELRGRKNAQGESPKDCLALAASATSCSLRRQPVTLAKALAASQQGHRSPHPPM